MSIAFSCPHCGQAYEMEDEYAGCAAECAACQAEITIPELPPAASPPDPELSLRPAASSAPPEVAAKPTGGIRVRRAEPEVAPEAASAAATEAPPCAKCGKQLGSPEAVLCIHCGHHQKIGKSIGADKPEKATVKKAGKFGIGVVVALGSAVLGGLIWGGLGIKFDVELGWVAWLIGGITGGAVRFLIPDRSWRAGMLAALLALSGLVIGKSMIAVHLMGRHDTEMAAEKKDAKPDDLGEISVWDIYTTLKIEKGELGDPYADCRKLAAENVAPADPKMTAALDKAEEVQQSNAKTVHAQLAKTTGNNLHGYKIAQMEDDDVRFLLANAVKRGEIKVTPESDGEGEDALVRFQDARHEWETFDALKTLRASFNGMTAEEKAKVREARHARELAEYKESGVRSAFGIVAFLVLFFNLHSLLWGGLALVTAWKGATFYSSSDN